MVEGSTRNASTMNVKMLAPKSGKASGKGKGVSGSVVRASIPYVKADVPVLILFRALGCVVRGECPQLACSVEFLSAGVALWGAFCTICSHEVSAMRVMARLEWWCWLPGAGKRATCFLKVHTLHALKAVGYFIGCSMCIATFLVQRIPRKQRACGA